MKNERCKRSTRNCGRIAVITLFTMAILLSTGCTSGRAQEGRVADLRNGASVRTPSGKLVFMLTTGFEDLVEVRLCLEDIKAAQKSGYFEEVIWLVRGRGVDALGAAEGALTRPSEIVGLAREVKATGVRIIASTDALREQKIANLDPKPTDLVDDSATLMARLVSQKHQIIRY